MLETARLRRDFIDLTESNPTRVDLPWSDDAEILRALADPASLRYQPTPEGLPAARQAVADYYRRCHRQIVDPDRLLLTASTSEAYAFAWKLLCDPGDRILVPAPSYPLFESLAGLEGVGVDRYPLHHERGWFVDFELLAAQVTPRTRAVVVVNPNNPTGSYLKADERERLVSLCAEHRLALVSDEVFADYAVAPDATRVPTLIDEARVLTLCLSGLSKVAALPQLKLGWMHVHGPHSDEALLRLEHIADSYLSVSAPVQHALPSLLRLSDQRRQLLVHRLSQNRATLAALTADTALTLLPAEGGWTSILRLPAAHTDALWARHFLDAGVWVQPGFFYDFADGAWAVLSLLSPPAAFRIGVTRLVEATVSRL